MRLAFARCNEAIRVPNNNALDQLKLLNSCISNHQPSVRGRRGKCHVCLSFSNTCRQRENNWYSNPAASTALSPECSINKIDNRVR